MAIPVALKKEYPGKTEDEIRAILWKLRSGSCFLCGQKIPFSDLKKADIDHIIPKSDGGSDDEDNLAIVHEECNAFKRSNSSINVKPFLKFRAFMRSLESPGDYSQCMRYFEVEPIQVSIDVVDKEVKILIPDRGTICGTLFEEKTPDGPYVSYTYVDLPREVIFNDDVQPRVIKESHLWKIYQDLLINPLHEAPGCRVIGTLPGPVSIAMFDGQHKTLANWLVGRNSIVSKLYLNLDKEATITLVNSIQARIMKLPLTPFEYIAKMSHEWQEKYNRYVSVVSDERASEVGFINWLPSRERAKGKQILYSAIVDSVVGNEDFKWRKRIASSGGRARVSGSKARDLVISERTFRSKVLDNLLDKNPSRVEGKEGKERRRVEAENVTRVLNLVYDCLFQPEDGVELNEREQERAKRALYQAGAEFWAKEIRAIVGIVLTKDGLEALSQKWSGDQWSSIEGMIRRMFEHNLWFAPFDADDDMRALYDALLKNEDVRPIARKLGMESEFYLGKG